MLLSSLIEILLLRVTIAKSEIYEGLDLLSITFSIPLLKIMKTRSCLDDENI